MSKHLIDAAASLTILGIMLVCVYATLTAMSATASPTVGLSNQGATSFAQEQLVTVKR